MLINSVRAPPFSVLSPVPRVSFGPNLVHQLRREPPPSGAPAGRHHAQRHCPQLGDTLPPSHFRPGSISAAALPFPCLFHRLSAAFPRPPTALSLPGVPLQPGGPRLTAAIPMDNPYCSCKLTRVAAQETADDEDMPAALQQSLALLLPGADQTRGARKLLAQVGPTEETTYSRWSGQG